ncbi:uncharacterized protein [Dysidea avara]|uniref:uncharacterized protein n=1 Tax=Dysidea avara TaxID=196820 RepID=UPI0033282416
MSQLRNNLLCVVVYIAVVMVIRSHALISVSRTLIIPTTDYAKFCCRSTSDSGSNEPVEWLNSNLDVLTTTDKIRIRTSSRHPTCKSSLQFRPPSISVAGSYWCRKVNSNDKVEVKLVIESKMATYQTISAPLGSDVYLDCPDHNSTISWAINRTDHINFTTELSYSQNMSGMVIHSITPKQKGCYTCYSEEDAIGYTMIKVITERPSQNQIVLVNVSEQVVLNCTVSSLPDPVYNWSIPDTCSSCPLTNSNSVMIFTADITDSGEYVCEAENEYERILVTFTLSVTVYPTFIFSDQLVIVQERVVLRKSDVFINCSVNYGTEYNTASWQLDNEPLWVNETSKYCQNTSGVMINNVTVEDEGNYTCSVGQLKATVLVKVKWPPELSIAQNMTVLVNVSESVVLNCTVSSSPDPMYNWSIPDTCSSCPHINNDSVIIFTADITDSGKYVCDASNEYGSIQRRFIVHVMSKPLISRNTVPILRDYNRENSNVMLSCGVYYAHPSPEITWNMMAKSSRVYQKLEQNSTGKYIMHNNGSIEVYYRFILESDHLIFMCAATNKYGSAENVFHLWDHEVFNQEQTLLLYIKVQNCQDATNEPDEVFNELRQWFGVVCECNGHNNLYDPEQACVDGTTASVTTSVHPDGNRTANMLIDLVKSELQERRVKLPSGWIVCLSPDCEYNGQDFIIYVKNLMTNCQVVINNSINIIQSEIEGLLGSVCNCNFQLLAPTCLNNSTASITAVIKPNGNHTAQMMIDLIEENIQERNPSVMYLKSGWVLCLSPDCEWEPVTNNMLESSDSHSVPLTVGLVVGIPCALIVILLCIIVIIWIVHKRSPKMPKKPMSCDNKDPGHIYDELSMFTMIPPLAAKNATPSPKSDKVVFDTSRVQPPSYQPLPKPRYESCSAASMEKYNDYHIERDVRSIKDEDCYFSKPQYENCNACSTEKCNDYHIEKDIRSTKKEDGHFSMPQYESCSATSIEKYDDYRIGEDTRSITDENCQKMIDKTELEPYSKLVHHK